MHEGSQGTMPITVKCRIGTDSIQEENLYSNLCRFIETVAYYISMRSLELFLLRLCRKDQE